jgi:peptidoglycan/xylan/chitin deacetylase (PgdA/CDA1 family)
MKEKTKKSEYTTIYFKKIRISKEKKGKKMKKRFIIIGMLILVISLLPVMNSAAQSCGTCTWYGTDYPVCCNTATGWGWENNQSCISQDACVSAGQTCTGCSGGSTTTSTTGTTTSSSSWWWWSSTTTSNSASTTTSTWSSSTTSNWGSSTTSIGGSGNISVRARGVTGNEKIEIRVNGSAVATYTVSTSYQNYSANGSGTIQVAFINDDGGDYDVQVDYITVDGTTYQAENQSTNTGVYQDGSCGGSNSEWLHCEGYIEFSIGGSTTPVPGTTTTSSWNSTTTTSSGGTAGNVYLTFDDGPTGNSASLCSSLKNAGCNAATFFVIGQNMPGNSSAYKSAGFSVQNHSQTHSHMTSWSYQQVYNDLQQCSQAIQSAGFPQPSVIRLPYLESNSTIQSACSDLGLQIISPTVDTKDWNGASTQAIISACDSLNAGGNPLLHENQANTLAAVSTIVQNLKSRGLGFAQY